MTNNVMYMYDWQYRIRLAVSSNTLKAPNESQQDVYHSITIQIKYHIIKNNRQKL